MPNWTVNPQCVGQAPAKIARMAGFEVPADTSILCCHVEGVGKKFPLSAEKLSPVLSLYFVPDFKAAVDICFALLKFGGAGHTAAIYSTNDARTREYALRMPANRVLVNTPAPQGSTAMTLGCGAVAGNITSDNIGPQHLMNIKRLAYTVRQPEEAFEMPLDYDAAPLGEGLAREALAAGGAMDRAAVVSAVERFLLSKGIPLPAAASAVAPAPNPASAQVTESIIASITADVVNRFLTQRAGGSGASSSTGATGNPGGYG
jgi:acetaldehyde dehydrogenase (acetylating)